MHSKDEPLFRVGSYYRDNDGDLVKLNAATSVGMLASYFNDETGEWELHGGVFNSEGVCLNGLHSRRGRPYDLVPGECDEQGNPIDSDGLSDALSEQAKHLKGDPIEEKSVPSLGALLRQALERGKPTMTPTLDAMGADPNAAMIARDGPAKRCFCGDTITGGTRVVHRTEDPCYYAAEPSTAHPPIAGLMRENGFSHKLGSAQIGWKR